MRVGFKTMERKFVSLIVALFVAAVASAQIPAGYYSPAEGKTGNELKSALYDIIKGHVEYPYTSKGTDVWDILKETDRDPNNPANVILLYTGLSVDAEQEYNDGKGWTREHVWAKIHGNFGTEPGAGTDVHHLRPCADEVNTERSSRWFAECSTPVYYNGKPTGCYKSNTEWVWKPRAEVIGDVARMIFYMATRYEGENGEPDLEIVDYLPSGNNTTEPIFAKLSDLIAWHLADPVDEFEMNRNNVIYSYQGNRNPFIDHPEYVTMIWSNGPASAPMFVSRPVTDARVGLPYQYDVSAYIADDSKLTFSLKESPEWLSLVDYADGTALLSGIPDTDASGSYIVTLTVTSADEQTVSQTFFIDVENPGGNSNPSAIDAEVCDKSVSVYGGKLFVSSADGLRISIYNMVGQQRLQTVYTEGIDVSALKQGVYILIVEDGNIRVRQRFVVQ